MSDKSRVFTTSFRYNEVVGNVLDSFQGKTTADKIEFMCLDYYENKEQREKFLKDLDKQIEQKKKELDKLSNKIYSLRNVTNDLESLLSSIKECNT